MDDPITFCRVVIGLLSDTHGHADTALKAVELLINEGADYLIHCGDVGDTDVIAAMAGHPGIFVFGNNDWDQSELEQFAKNVDVVCGGKTAKLSFGGKRIIVTHGDDNRLMQQIVKDQMVDFLFVGHTHVPADHTVGKVRIINPGALYRAATKTVALLDLETDVLRFLTV